MNDKYTINKNRKKNKQKTLKNMRVNSNITAIIDTKAIQYNIENLKKYAKTDIMPVLKGNAYGHGLYEIAKIIRNLDIQYIGVATLTEALFLRKSGDKGRILAWLYNINSPELIEAFNSNIDIAIFDNTIISQFISLIPPNKKIKVHIFVDTGINRTGIPYENALDTFIDINKCPKIELVGMMSHLVDSSIKNNPIVNNQLSMFRQLREQLNNHNIHIPLVHIANTGACINYDVSDFTFARCGAGIYGIMPNFRPNKLLKLVLSVKTNIIQIKNIKKGDGIGFYHTYIAPKNMQICILPIGYSELLTRNISKPLYVYINKTKRKVLGLINMEQIVVESKKIDTLNDEAFIFGNGYNCKQTIYTLSNFPIEFVTKLNNNIQRICL